MKQFYEVGRLEHMTRAAENLHISQSTLSRTISRLESDLGYPLFNRSGHRISLTEYGKRFYTRVERILGELEENQRDLDELLDFGQKTIHLATSVPGINIQLIDAFRSKYPDIAFRQKLCIDNEIIDHLTEGRVDIAFMDTSPTSYGINSHIIWREKLFVVVPLDNPLSEKDNVSMSELKNERFLSSATDTGLTQITQRYAKMANFVPEVVFETGTIRDAMRLSSLGIGLLFISRFSLKVEALEAEAGGKSILNFAKPLEIIEPDCSWNIYLASMPKRFMPRYVKKFYSFTINHFQTMSDADIVEAAFYKET